MLMVKYTAEQTLTSNPPPEIAGEPKKWSATFFYDSGFHYLYQKLPYYNNITNHKYLL